MKGESPDQHALNVARAVQEAVAPATVVLFGSRARNRHRENSDVDLLIIADGENPVGAEIRARNTAHAYLKANPPRLAVDVFSTTRGEFARCRRANQHIAGQAARYGVVMNAHAYLKANPPRLAVDVFSTTRGEFARCRRANQHIAGQAARYGVVMNGEDLDYPSGYQDSYPTHWPETRQRLENVEEFLHQFNQMVDENHWNQRLLGFSAQQAVENALKGWLSAYNDTRTFSHELVGLWTDIQNLEDWSGPDMEKLGNAVTGLFSCIQYEDPDRPGEAADRLTNYAVTYRYGRTFYRMTQKQRLELREAINDALAAIMDRIHAISGTTTADLWTEGQRPWP